MIIDPCLQESRTLQFALMAQQLKKQGRDIISLGLGEPEYNTPGHIRQAAVDALAAGFTRYGAAAGLPELRVAVAEKLRSDNRIMALPEHVLIVPGAKNALFVACAAVLRPGDEVINLTPCYVSNQPIIKLAEPRATIRNVPLCADTFRIDRRAVEQVLGERTRLLLTNYPNNPSGKMLDADDAEFLCRIVKERRLVWISDEIYERLALDGHHHISPAAFEDIAENVITVNGFSKAYAMTGWRIGYSVAHPRWTSVMTIIHQQLNTNTAVFIQKAALAALEGSQAELNGYVRELENRARLFREFGDRAVGLAYAPLQGGLFGFLHIGASGLSSDEFSAQLLEATSVAVLPGISFGENFDAWVRISLCAPTARLTDGLARMGQFIQSQRNRCRQ